MRDESFEAHRVSIGDGRLLLKSRGLLKFTTVLETRKISSGAKLKSRVVKHECVLGRSFTSFVIHESEWCAFRVAWSAAPGMQSYTAVQVAGVRAPTIQWQATMTPHTASNRASRESAYACAPGSCMHAHTRSSSRPAPHRFAHAPKPLNELNARKLGGPMGEPSTVLDNSVTEGNSEGRQKSWV
ncbi:hypothetical protein IE81DRAFT_355413 [Ceraceosorus guamensis]|uniref:Uncharacterized protein n=1 Tax=Ceraceosorus guamensis TaxID=1522189 RepID=A0A316W0R4_9BASI|nr:hypothetical protein IE81DRAFT_355413 [Ceraceosorus guamensis]PWN43289.1 hypothetical protein IE81DRAFT_355413 [Ceraceosorus guamensis]